MESPVDGVESLSEVHNSVSSIDHNVPSTSGIPRSSRPPLRASRNHGRMKDAYEEPNNVEHDGARNKEKQYYYYNHNGKIESVESCLGKNISTIETKLCVNQLSDNCILGSSKGVVDSEIPFSSSPPQPKESSTKSGINELSGKVSVDKSVESGEVNDNSCELNVSRKSSICRGSSGSDVSDESSISISSLSSALYKPHKANDVRWEAVQAIRVRDGGLEMRHFRLLKKLGCGDIGSVYLAELSGTRTCFAMKVMNKTELSSRKKLPRSQTEREILQSLDHPFLPTLYSHFETESFSCLVMEFCPGGDLHALRQRQPGKYFSEHAAMFALHFLFYSFSHNPFY